MDRALRIPIDESDAAWVLAGVEEQLRNDAALQDAKSDGAKCRTEYKKNFDNVTFLAGPR